MITVYTLPNCSNCERTKKFLDRSGLSYEVKDLTSDLAQEFKSRGHLSAPVVVTDGDEWSGFQPKKISELAAAQEDGLWD